MSYQLQTTLGTLEAVIDDNCGLKKFYSIANVMAKELKVKFIGKEDDSATVDWHFKYKGHPLTLQHNIYNGVSIFTKEGKANKAITELAKFLQGKVF
jgi:ABC-type tungstate transport system permease subunit